MVKTLVYFKSFSYRHILLKWRNGCIVKTDSTGTWRAPSCTHVSYVFPTVHFR